MARCVLPGFTLDSLTAALPNTFKKDLPLPAVSRVSYHYKMFGMVMFTSSIPFNFYSWLIYHELCALNMYVIFLCSVVFPIITFSTK